jgi:hypothetical protein
MALKLSFLRNFMSINIILQDLDGSTRIVPNGSSKKPTEVIVGLEHSPTKTKHAPFIQTFKPGTSLANMLKKVGVQPCGGCNQRAKKLDTIYQNIVNKVNG